MGSAGQLRGKWIFKTLKGTDVSSYKIYVVFKTASEYVMYDGCNSGGGTFSTGVNHSINFSRPMQTLMHCPIYEKGIKAGNDIPDIRAYSVANTSLILYDGKGNKIITAEKE